MSATLEQLYEMQKKLDARIISEKGLEGFDLLPNTVLALQVKVAALANEWRGFKHWSNDRAPRIRLQHCLGCGTIEEPEVCPICNNENPLLYEYVECLSLFLQLARLLELPEKDLYCWEDELEYETVIVFSELLHNVGLILAEKMLVKPIDDVKAFKRVHFRSALFIFYALGEQRLDLEFKDIAAAYVARKGDAS